MVTWENSLVWPVSMVPWMEVLKAAAYTNGLKMEPVGRFATA